MIAPRTTVPSSMAESGMSGGVKIIESSASADGFPGFMNAGLFGPGV
jgi:hypothetical protein